MILKPEKEAVLHLSELVQVRKLNCQLALISWIRLYVHLHAMQFWQTYG
jgi:hypothetical protein